MYTSVKVHTWNKCSLLYVNYISIKLLKKLKASQVPRKSHGQKSLVGYSSWVAKELDMI